MRALTGELLLTAYDAAAEEHDLERSLTLLSLALPGSTRRQLAELTLAERNLLLLRLREISFGSTLRAFGACGQCGARLELTLLVAPLIERLQSQQSSGPLTWRDGEKQFELRQATTQDLLAVLDVPIASEAQDRLLQRCMSVSGRPHEAEPPAAMPELFEKFDRLHAATEISCAIKCPDCSSQQTIDLDIARYLWLEVRSAARRLLQEIHELAWAYGWSERVIARMSGIRRNAYLEMLYA